MQLEASLRVGSASPAGRPHMDSAAPHDARPKDGAKTGRDAIVQLVHELFPDAATCPYRKTGVPLHENRNFTNIWLRSGEAERLRRIVANVALPSAALDHATGEAYRCSARRTRPLSDNLVVGSGWVPAYRVIKLLAIAGQQAVGGDTRVVFAQIFGAYLKPFRGLPMVALPILRHDMARYKPGYWYAARARVTCERSHVPGQIILVKSRTADRLWYYRIALLDVDMQFPGVSPGHIGRTQQATTQVMVQLGPFCSEIYHLDDLSCKRRSESLTPFYNLSNDDPLRALPHASNHVPQLYGLKMPLP